MTEQLNAESVDGLEDITAALNRALETYKQVALTEFVKNFLMPALKQYGWDVEHVIEALASYAFVRPGWEQVVKHLEDAAHEINRTRNI